MKLNGTVTETKGIEVDVTLEEIFKAARAFGTEQLLQIIKEKVINKMRENDASISSAYLTWDEKKWEVFSFTDYHKNEDVYSQVRLVNDEEQAIFDSLKTLEKTLKQFGV
ncbi:hypothetical protein GAP32_396 [Cronobacter phage vB_CsaM_GAP32]|uniref:Uncharacterized protein n=1 Tax=Cronobacter phage vB_CsaM_GAP32 TaxID=1141136 RepID=K4F741_9CAUD|nr:hypothetical protein GAP32_396 [Cronobacter phage vB_CsaM_GAP32]AFC21848.1 hypothetical protein GAP32_396 [Cronobacter phage vB_CsaM_GAP32]